MFAAAVVVACGLHFPCDVPTQVDKPHKPAAHVTTKHHEPVKHSKPPAEVVIVSVPPLAPLRPVEPLPPIMAPHVDTPTTKGHPTMFTNAMHSLANLFALIGWAGAILAGLVLYYVVRHGFPWVKQKAQSIWASIVGDWTKVEGVVETVESDLKPRLAALEAAFANFTTHIQVPAPAAPVPAPAAPVVAAIPAAAPAVVA